MNAFRVGDIVARKSYGGDVYFRITGIKVTKDGREPVYVLKGMMQRLEADSDGYDLVIQNPRAVQYKIGQNIMRLKRNTYAGARFTGFNLLKRFTQKPGKVLHIDSDEKFLNICMKHYSGLGIESIGRFVDVSEQPGFVRKALERFRPDILVLTGHDGLKKATGNIYSMDNYSSSRYFIESVKEARSFEGDSDRLFIFAGACQSYYEAIIKAGANFASSPGRVLINALDPAFVGERVSLTERKYFVTPEEIAKVTESGSKGIWGNRSKGHMDKF